MSVWFAKINSVYAITLKFKYFYVFTLKNWFQSMVFFFQPPLLFCNWSLATLSLPGVFIEIFNGNVWLVAISSLWSVLSLRLSFAKNKPLNFAQTYWHILLQRLRLCNNFHRNNTTNVNQSHNKLEIKLLIFILLTLYWQGSNFSWKLLSDVFCTIHMPTYTHMYRSLKKINLLAP